MTPEAIEEALRETPEERLRREARDIVRASILADIQKSNYRAITQAALREVR